MRTTGGRTTISPRCASSSGTKAITIRRLQRCGAFRGFAMSGDFSFRSVCRPMRQLRAPESIMLNMVVPSLTCPQMRRRCSVISRAQSKAWSTSCEGCIGPVLIAIEAVTTVDQTDIAPQVLDLRLGWDPVDQACRQDGRRASLKELRTRNSRATLGSRLLRHPPISQIGWDPPVGRWSGRKMDRLVRLE